jgi:hypothetical protein
VSAAPIPERHAWEPSGLRRNGRKIVAFVVLPLVAYAALVWYIDAHGAATLMLGAAAGSSLVGFFAMGAALTLRLYTVLVLPGLVVARLVLAAFELAQRGTRVRRGQNRISA